MRLVRWNGQPHSLPAPCVCSARRKGPENTNTLATRIVRWLGQPHSLDVAACVRHAAYHAAVDTRQSGRDPQVAL